MNFFKGKKHTEESKEKMRNSWTKARRKKQKILTDSKKDNVFCNKAGYCICLDL